MQHRLHVSKAWFALVCLPVALASAHAATLAPLTAGTGAQPPAPWRVVGLPDGKPVTQLDVAEVDGQRALRIRTDKSYGNLVHAWQGPAGTLRWRWRLEQPLQRADLRSKEGDDVAVKVCLLFDLPLDALPLGERTRMRLARTLSGEALPAATLCYVWDTALPAGTELPNAYTQRVRYIVLDSGVGQLGKWVTHQRDVAADFRRNFGHESPVVPPLTGVAVGADADNTGGSSRAWLADLTLSP